MGYSRGEVVWGFLRVLFVMPPVDLQGMDLEFDSAAVQETYQPKEPSQKYFVYHVVCAEWKAI